MRPLGVLKFLEDYLVFGVTLQYELLVGVLILLLNLPLHNRIRHLSQYP